MHHLIKSSRDDYFSADKWKPIFAIFALKMAYKMPIDFNGSE